VLLAVPLVLLAAEQAAFHLRVVVGRPTWRASKAHRSTAGTRSSRALTTTMLRRAVTEALELFLTA
jgi:hypothetical protein